MSKDITLFSTFPVYSKIMTLNGSFHITKLQFPPELGSFTVYYRTDKLAKMV